MRGDASRYSYTPTTMDKLAVFDERAIVCCAACEFGMIERDVDAAELASYYASAYSGKAKKNAETKAVDLRTRYAYDPRSASQLALIRQHHEVHSDSVIVEIGAGTGDMLFSLKQSGYRGRYIAFEPQREAHDVLISLGAEVHGVVFDLEQARKYADTANLVIMSHSLEHFNPGSIPQVVEGVSVMLRAGGCFFCEVPNANLTKYPNAGERVVPHLSFFSEEALRRAVTSKGLAAIFSSTCGDSQIGKNHQAQLAALEKSGAFVYVPDPETGVLRNQKYHEYLREKTRRQQLRRMMLNLLMKVLGRRLLFKAIDLLRRWRQKPHNEVLSSSAFCYGADREFIRLLAQK